MYKKAFKHLQWLEKSRDHLAHNRTMNDGIKAENAAFIKKLRVGVKLNGIVEKIDSGKASLTFHKKQIRGEAFLPKSRFEINVNDKIIVEIVGITLGSDGNLFLKTSFVHKYYDKQDHKYICKKCNASFETREQLVHHLEFLCSIQKCSFCNEYYSAKDEFKHSSGRCKYGPVPRR